MVRKISKADTDMMDGFIKAVQDDDDWESLGVVADYLEEEGETDPRVLQALREPFEPHLYLREYEETLRYIDPGDEEEHGGYEEEGETDMLRDEEVSLEDVVRALRDNSWRPSSYPTTADNLEHTWLNTEYAENQTGDISTRSLHLRLDDTMGGRDIPNHLLYILFKLGGINVQPPRGP